MCGLTFLYDTQPEPGDLTARSRQALRRLAHRGPDDEGLWQNGPVAIGHRRLAILDLQASRQPMSDTQGRYTLAYNGEVYNFRELRPALAARWQFRTHGDTEVVLAGLILEGAGFLQRMEGMWALALWDRQERRLLLARDRMGKKPLYYRCLPDGFACASELPALAALDAGPWHEDLDSSADYLRYGYYLPGTTAYHGVQEVLPAHTLSWTPGGHVQQQPYWQLAIGGFSGSRSDAAARLRELLVQAVRRRMVADVEVGAFLSGGVDSSLVTATMVRELGVHPKTFTIGFSEEAFDERDYADTVARELGTDHYAECLQGWDHDQLLGLLRDHVGQPFSDSSLLPTALVSQVAARRVKVALSGDGGDELFSGYQRYQARSLLRWFTRVPAPLRNAALAFIGRLPEPMAHHSRSVLKKAHLFADVVARQSAETPYVAPVFYSVANYARLVPELVGRGHAAPGLPDEARADALLEMMVSDALVYLPQDILLKVDRASMAYSLEARAPFLDREVVELAFALPRRWHRRRGAGKRMLRQSCAELLPASIWRRRKQGFGVPIHHWFRAELGTRLETLLSDTDGHPFNAPAVLQMLAAHRRRQRDHGYRLWSIYVYLLWRQHVGWPAS